MGNMRLYCVVSYIKLAGDLFVAHAADKQAKHFQFAHSQLTELFALHIQLALGLSSLGYHTFTPLSYKPLSMF